MALLRRRPFFIPILPGLDPMHLAANEHDPTSYHVVGQYENNLNDLIRCTLQME